MPVMRKPLAAKWRGSDLARSNTATSRYRRAVGQLQRYSFAVAPSERAFHTRRRVRRPGDQHAESRLGRSHRARILRFRDSGIEPAVAAWVSARAIVLMRHLLNSFGITKFAEWLFSQLPTKIPTTRTAGANFCACFQCALSIFPKLWNRTIASRC